MPDIDGDDVVTRWKFQQSDCFNNLCPLVERNLLLFQVWLSDVRNSTLKDEGVPLQSHFKGA